MVEADMAVGLAVASVMVALVVAPLTGDLVAPLTGVLAVPLMGAFLMGVYLTEAPPTAPVVRTDLSDTVDTPVVLTVGAITAHFMVASFQSDLPRGFGGEVSR